MARPNYRQRESIRNRLAAIGAPCSICGKPIDYSLTTWVDPKDGRTKRHPLSFEYDHRVSLAAGGHPSSMENAQPAHRICNQRKGDGRRHKAQETGRGPKRVDEIPTSRAW